MTLSPETAASPSRTQTTTVKVKTEFGSMHVHVELDHTGRPVGGSISTPGKEPDSQIARLVEILSGAFGQALASAGGYE